MERLETTRLILRDWEISDLEDFYAYAKVQGVGEMAGWPHHTSIAVSTKLLNHFINTKDCYALVLKATNQVIGSLAIHQKSMDPNYPATTQRELGYVLSKDYWGQGLMLEAVSAAIYYVFEVLQVDALWCGHFTHNNQSRRVIEKVGFTFYTEGVYEAPLLQKNFPSKKYLFTRDDYFLGSKRLRPSDTTQSFPHKQG